MVRRSPSAVSTAMGFSSRDYPARFRARLRRTCAWPALWSVNSRDPTPGPKAGRRLSWGSVPLRHMPARRIRLLPGIPAPGTFRPQGLATLPAVFSLPRLTTARRPSQRPWGSPFRVLLPPAGGTSLEVSPLLSFFQSARRRVVATPEVGSGGRGARLAAARRRRRPNLALLGLGPSKASSSDHLRTGFPILFPLGLLLGMLPTDHAQPGLQGIFSGGSGLVSLETACLPGVWHLVDRGTS
jgi:hypothetical protein